MSDLTQTFVVQPNNINITVDNTNLNFTPSDVALSVYAGGIAQVNGTSGQLQYNNGGILGGVSGTNYDGANLTLGAVGNIKITGGAANYVLTTNGSGNLSWVDPAVGPANALTATIANTHIYGGTNGYVLQTDGTGNLAWTAQTGGGGNGSPGGSNTQIQYNDSGLFGGSVGFSFDKVTENMAVPGNVSANYFIGNGSQLTGISFSSISNGVSNVNIPTSGGNVTTSVGGAANVIVVAFNGANIAGYANITGNISTAGTTSIQQAKEKVIANATGATGTVNFDILNSAIQLQTANATDNFTLNIRGNSTTTFNSIISNNESLTCTFVNKNGTTGYYANSITIDGANANVLWGIGVPGGAPTSGTASGRDVYTFNIIKTGTSAYTVFGGVLGYL